MTHFKKPSLYKDVPYTATNSSTMSNGEAKRYYFVPTGGESDSGRLEFTCNQPSLEGDDWFVSASDHERIVAELKAQLEQSETKVTWLLRDNEKNVRERDAVIATQKRVIEKLTEQRNRAANRHHKQSLNKYLERISKFEEEIKAIEKGEA